MMEQLNAVSVGTGEPEIAGVLETARSAFAEAGEGFRQRAEAMGAVVQAIDDASSVADPGEGEVRAYENELEAAIVIRNELEAAAALF